LLTDGYDPDDVFSKDVSLKDQSNVYHRIPVAAFLFPTMKLNDELGNALLGGGTTTVREKLMAFGKTEEEIRNVLLRLAGRLTPPEFAKRCRRQAKESGDTKPYFQKRRIAVGEDLIRATEDVHLQAVSEVICQHHFQIPPSNDKELPDYPTDDNNNDEQTLTASSSSNVTAEAELLSARDLIKTPYVDMFSPQALFREGLDRAKQQLRQKMDGLPEDPISWGNTNTRPNEYVAALEAAEEANRPVKFVAWGTGRLTRVPRQELLRRNVAGLRNTGRYIPAGALAASLGRVEKLMKEAQIELKSMYDILDFTTEQQDDKMDEALASLAGFQMLENKRVIQIGDPKF
jgi:hypothetical protein